jgi:hypothetical protein
MFFGAVAGAILPPNIEVVIGMKAALAIPAGKELMWKDLVG